MLSTQAKGNTAIHKDLRTAVQGGIACILDGIDVPHSELLPKKSEIFVQKVLKDTKGNPIKNEPVHNIMHRFLRLASEKGFSKKMILGGMGLGKTEQICIGYILYRIAKNPNLLVKLVHVSDEAAATRCRSIRDYIARDDDFKELAPHIRPTNIWGSGRFTVTRSAPSKDGTVEAYPVLGTGIGGRANLIVFDDAQDLRTAVYEPTTREKIKETINNVWLTRLIPEDSEVIYIVNKWSDVDYASFVQRNPSWAWMSLAVSECKTFIQYEDGFGRKMKLPLWSKFDKKALELKHQEMGTRDFNRGYRLIPYSDKDKTFTYFERCCHFGISPKALIEDESSWVFLSGIDFSSTKRPGTILSVLAVHKKTGLKVPVEIVVIRNSSDLVQYMIRFYREYGIDNFIAENNGVQDVIIDMLQTELGEEKYKRYNIKITGYLTGRQKADNEIGLPGMDKEFENKEWMFCFNEKPDVSDDMEHKPWSRLYYEMLNHPYYGTSDMVMSLWFARNGAVKMLRGSGGPQVY